MRVPRLYLPQKLSPGQAVALPTDRRHYLTRVLRLQAGAPLILFDGTGGQYQATLADAGPTAGHALIGAFDDQERESPLAITLMQGISRGERMDLTLRKATELGVTRVLPLTTARCEVKLSGPRLQKRRQHWHSILASACEQCGRNRLPELLPPQTLDQSLDGMTATTASDPPLRLLLDPRARQGLTDLSRPGLAVTMLIGPEGGLSPDEIQRATASGFHGLRLGPRVLRTETAPLAALAAVQLLWGDMG